MFCNTTLAVFFSERTMFLTINQHTPNFNERNRAVVGKVQFIGSKKKYRRSPINGFIGFIRKFLGQK
jgi:hypothetical protein